ncbi:hypothetical protein JRO89_XS12G0199500 [Xanthoceras sorbifolium]|uniref:Major facilitator superfamily (MFS) profile domain-containing protein n=1 Tax=Xanthoceras sorbifolium TaxID=99658 RepID=A0ABQ8HD52_9ROSI|nr:hypothetical protein JRO89_XS12G0199500 [Xanthoceras sorbifolium]
MSESENESNIEEALLKKNDENCPGCIIERLKHTDSAIPFKLLFSVWIVVLSAALPISSLFPFLYFMIRDFNIAKGEEDIGYYAGFVGSAFMFGRALTSVLWGVIADRYGRKPVIMFGIGAVVIFNILFGLSTNFWMAVSMRFLLGSLCGILGPMRAYASEVCRKEYQALGMSIISTSWGVGLVIGPALGGFFAQIQQRSTPDRLDWLEFTPEKLGWQRLGPETPGDVKGRKIPNRRWCRPESTGSGRKSTDRHWSRSAS